MQICGKTGTAENKIRVAGKTYQLKDHSIFVAFAPKENPTISIAVFIENEYRGSRWAGPIATLMVEKYVNGVITRKDLEERMLNGSLASEYEKIENIIRQRAPEKSKDAGSATPIKKEIDEAIKEEQE